MSKCPICKNKTKFQYKKSNYITNYNYYQCQNCDFLFTNPMPTQTELNSYYNSLYHVEKVQKEKVRAKAKLVLQRLKKIKGKNLEVLEIGCSYGYFLKEAEKQKHKCSGIELSKITAKFAKENLKTNNIYNVNFETWKTKNKYDVVVLLDVIEHLPDPNKSISKIKKLLKKDGVIVFTTPNTNSLEYKLYGKRWEWVSPPAHISLFNQKTVRKIMNENHFEELELSSFKGDSAGNTLFHLFLTLRYLIADLVQASLPKRAVEKMRKGYSNQLRKASRSSNSEFSGLLGAIKKITNYFEPLFKKSQKKHGASLLAIYQNG